MWNARSIPPYESFTIACDQTFLADRCTPGTHVQFIIRSSDGRTFAQTLAPGSGASAVLLRGGYAMGPAGAPFGFYRRTPVPGAAAPPSPPNLAPDPLQTIAVVSAVDRAYEIRLDGIVTVGSRSCYHLRLRALRDPLGYPLRELWIDTATYDVVRLTYAWPFNGTSASVTYDFAPVGAQAIWSIVHIDATAGREHVAEDLQNIEFPASEPPADFTP